MKASVARKVIDDCKLALAMMDEAKNADRLRVLWIGGLSLIRMVGHVLDKVDAKDQRIRVKLDEVWPHMKRHAIFADFIEGSRNRAIKEYEIDIYDQDTIVVIHESENQNSRPELISECLFMPLLDGPWAGEDARDVYREAIRFWQGVLSQVESGR